ncbi:MAG: hypothetical protein DRJ09_07430 [Bacteroidetes bacterium]|nr:MAG: hypothetical protein DRJ09_07430 [Bacteroidota bacterium]
MKHLGFILVLLTIFMLFSCQHAKENEPNHVTKKEQGLLNEYDDVLHSVKDIDSLYFLTDKYEQMLLQKKASAKILVKLYHKAANKFYAYSKYEVAKEYFQKAEKTYLKTGDTLMSVKMRGNQAVLMDLQGHYKESIKTFLEISEYFRKTNDTLPLAFAYGNIGVIYEELKNPEKAIEYAQKAMRLKMMAGDTLKIASNLNNIGVNYDELLHNPDSAIHYYQKALDIYKHYHKVDHYATVLNNLGRMYLEKDNYLIATENFNQSFIIFDSLGADNDKAAVLRNQGELYFALGDIPMATRKMKQSYELYKTIGVSEGLIKTSELLSKVYLAAGKYGQAASVMQFHNVLKDSLLNFQNQAIVAEMETKYQVKEKNRTIELLKLQEKLRNKKIKWQTMLLSSMVVLLILLGILFYSHRRRTQLSQQKLNLELQNYLLQVTEMQRELDNKKEDCGKKTNLEQIENANLSKQEMKVIRLIAEGNKNAEIAEKLFISQNTVKTHIKNIYSKLDVKNRVDALRKLKEGRDRT